MPRIQKTILLLLAIDLIISIFFLRYVCLWNEMESSVADSVTPEEGAIVGNPLSAPVTTGASSETGQLAETMRQADNARKRVKDEVVQQQKRFVQIEGENKGWITLKELAEISPEAYEDLLRQLENERRKCAEALAKRERFLEELDPELLAREEYEEFREALEFLNLCDRNILNGEPIPDRSTEYGWERIQCLRRIAKKYCCALVGCPEDALDRRKTGEQICEPSYFAYIPILVKPQNHEELP